MIKEIHFTYIVKLPFKRCILVSTADPKPTDPKLQDQRLFGRSLIGIDSDQHRNVDAVQIQYSIHT